MTAIKEESPPQTPSEVRSFLGSWDLVQGLDISLCSAVVLQLLFSSSATTAANASCRPDFVTTTADYLQEMQFVWGEERIISGIEEPGCKCTRPCLF